MRQRSTLTAGISALARVGGPPEAREFIDSDQTYYSPVIAPSAIVSAFCSIDSGTYRSTLVGHGSYLLQHVHLGHDVLVGDDVEIATGAIVGGSAEIGDGAKIGINATILPFRKVGAGATVGAGSVVTKDVPAGEVWAGNPARPIGAENPTPYTQRSQAPTGIGINEGEGGARKAPAPVPELTTAQ